MINPEFRRNLWLELSPQRLVLMVSVLGIIAALTVYLGNDPVKEGSTAHALLIVFSALGLMLAGGWGSFTVLASINSEVAERTWDQQRLSALSPWQMAWGKLLGASIYPWLGGLLCAAVVLVSGLLLPNSNPPRLILLLLYRPSQVAWPCIAGSWPAACTRWMPARPAAKLQPSSGCWAFSSCCNLPPAYCSASLGWAHTTLNNRSSYGGIGIWAFRP